MEWGRGHRLVSLLNRCVEKEAAAADGEVEGQARKEAASRREWSAKMKAAEWALKAHRDKQAMWNRGFLELRDLFFPFTIIKRSFLALLRGMV